VLSKFFSTYKRVKRDLKGIDITWEEAKELAADTAGWRQLVAKCIYCIASWYNNKIYWLQNFCAFWDHNAVEY